MLGVRIFKLERAHVGEPLTPSSEMDWISALWDGSEAPVQMPSLDAHISSPLRLILGQKQMAAEREKVGAEFQALRAFLVEQEGRLLGRLEELSREVTQKQNENLAQLGGEITQLSKLSSQIQETARKPDLDFLQVSLVPQGFESFILRHCEGSKNSLIL